MIGILKYHGWLRYDEYLRWKHSEYCELERSTVEAIGILKRNYNSIEKLIGWVRWRVNI